MSEKKLTTPPLRNNPPRFFPNWKNAPFNNDSCQFTISSKMKIKTPKDEQNQMPGKRSLQILRKLFLIYSSLVEKVKIEY